MKDEALKTISREMYIKLLEDDIVKLMDYFDWQPRYYGDRDFKTSEFLDWMKFHCIVTN